MPIFWQKTNVMLPKNGARLDTCSLLLSGVSSVALPSFRERARIFLLPNAAKHTRFEI